MLSEVISLLIGIVLIGLVCWLLMFVIDRLPMEGRFKQIARILVIIIAVLIFKPTGLFARSERVG